MSNIVIHRDNQNYGPYSLEQAKEMVSQGTLQAQDSAWMEGGHDWVPLIQLISERPPAAVMETKTVQVPLPDVPPVRAPKSNLTIAYSVLAALLLLLLAICVGIAVEVKNSVAPWLAFLGNSRPTAAVAKVDDIPFSSSSFLAVTDQVENDSIKATMVTDDSDKSHLCNRIMGEIYSLATKNESAVRLKMVVQIVGGGSAAINIDDLASVRNYPDKESYQSSEHRDFINSLLLSNGLIDATSAEIDPPRDLNSRLVGSTYYYQALESPRLGLHFLDATQVECLSDGVPYGQMCHYTVNGDTVTVPTSCSTLVLHADGDKLQPADMAYPLVKQ